jgi:peptide/nickel transport system ATP-binding protein
MSDVTTPEPALSVRDLRVVTDSPTGTAELLRGISFAIARGERVGLIGESGSGKSLTATAIMGLLPESLSATGSVELAGSAGNLLDASERTLSSLRGSAMSMVFQEPMTALNPLMRVGDQVAEVMLEHRTVEGRRAANARAIHLLGQVQLPDPAEASRAYPHQLSGGQRQRVMVAMAMANEPALLLCDEPTTALDVTVQAEVLSLVGALVRDRGSSLLLISHDIAVVARVCERVLVMYNGEIVEDGTVEQILTAPQHPYTRRLIAASDLSVVDERGRLGGSAAVYDDARTLATSTTPRADRRPDSSPTTAPHTPASRTPAPATTPAPAAASHLWRLQPDDDLVFNEQPGESLIRVRDLTRDYRRSGGTLFAPAPVVHGLRGVSVDVAGGQRLGIVGESGSGKSTLMRLLCALDAPTSGSIRVDGQELAGAKARQLRHFRSQVQIVFQDPMGSLDPRMRVRDIVAEPLRGVRRDETRERVIAQLAAVGLDADVLGRRPHEFSGGQRQRISIARALITRPRVLIADEAVSALDVSVRAQVLNLLADLVDEYSLTLVFVSHDLGVVRHTCDTVAVLSDGRIVESGPTEAVYTNPQHAYTQQLVAATPVLG